MFLCNVAQESYSIVFDQLKYDEIKNARLGSVKGFRGTLDEFQNRPTNDFLKKMKDIEILGSDEIEWFELEGLCGVFTRRVIRQ